MIVSCTSGCGCTPCNLIQSPIISWSYVVVVTYARSDRIQLSLHSSWLTVLFFLRTCGAKYLGASPSSQLWCQKRALLPFPIVTVVEELKRRRSVLLHGTSVPTHGFESSTHSCHSHLRRRALPNLSRSGTPNPPSSLGLHTVEARKVLIDVHSMFLHFVVFQFLRLHYKLFCSNNCLQYSPKKRVTLSYFLYTQLYLN